MCVHCANLIKAIDAYLAKADNDLASTLGDEGYIEPEETVDAITNLEESVAAALTAETSYIIKAVKKADSLMAFQMDIWPGVKKRDTLQDDLQAIFQEQFGEIVLKFADYYLSSIENGGGKVAKADGSIKIVRVSQQTTAWVESWSQQLASIMKLNSHKEIESILKKGLEDGAGVQEFARNIMDSGIRDEWYKARRVAVTEVLTAHRAAQQEAFMQSPSTKEKMWRHTGIYIVGPRANHKDMDGQKVPKDQPFELLGADGHFYHPMFPGDPSLPPGERIECHCTTQSIVDENIIGLPLEERQRLQQEAIDELDEKWFNEQEDKSKALAGFTDGTTIPTPDNNRENLISAIKGRFDSQITEPQRSEFGTILDGMTDSQLKLYDQMSQNHSGNLYHRKGGAAYYPSEKAVKMDIDNANWERSVQTGQTAAWQTKFHEESHQLDHILAKMRIDFDDPSNDLPTGVYAITDTRTTVGAKLLKAIKDDIISVINEAVKEKNEARVAIDLDPCIKPVKSLSRIPEDTKRTLIYWLMDNYQTTKDRALITLFTDAVGLATDGRITPYKDGFWGHKAAYNKDRDGSGATSETFATFGSMFLQNNEEQITAVKQLMPKTFEAYSDLFSKIMKMVQDGNSISYP